MSTQRTIRDKVEEAFPAPEFRENQDKAIEEAVKAFEEEDYDVVAVNAPTGAGKSLILYTILEALGVSAYYSTPLKALQEQLVEDEFIGGDVVEIMGRNNYDCILPGEDTTVDKGRCQKEADFDCHKKSECPYYSQKNRALNHDKTVANMSYLMAESMVPDEAEDSFGPRDILEVDECQGVEDWAETFIGVTISSRNVPDEVWSNITIPREDDLDSIEDAVEWIEEEVLPATKEMKRYIQTQAFKSESEVEDEDQLTKFQKKLERFLGDYEEHHWVYQVETDIRKNKPNERKIVFKPVKVGRFLDSLLWNRADNIILSSATIPRIDQWLEEIGLGDAKVKLLSLPSTFPVENRPIITKHSVGKMTYGEREDNAWPMAKKILQLAEFHKGEKGMIHCRGYNIAELLKRAFTNHDEATVQLPDPDGEGVVEKTFETGPWFRENVMMQDRYNREESLQNWIDGDTPVFFSVAMDEGIDLDGDKCRWQGLAKVMYPHMGDERVRYRIEEMDDWDWYNSKAAVQIQQAYGRAVRSKDDEAVFYLLDSSAESLIKRNADLFCEWFLEAIDDMPIDPSRGI